MRQPAAHTLTDRYADRSGPYHPVIVFVPPETLKDFEDRLRESEAALETAKKTVREKEPEVANLRLIVQGMRGLGGGSPGGQGQAAASTGTFLRVAADYLATTDRATYGGRPNLPTVLKDILSDGQLHDLNEICDLVQSYPAYVAIGYKPSRGSITNRLNDMSRGDDREIEKLPRRRYRILPAEGAENAVGVAGSPNPGPQTDGQKPPAEEVISPQPGHP